MAVGKKKAVLMKAVSELKEADYSRVPELESIYRRLSSGREQFAGVLDKNIKAVMQISSLDLTMQHHTEQIMQIANNVAAATESMFGAIENSAVSDGRTNSQEELTNTIIHVSEEMNEVNKKIEVGQNELTSIKELSKQTIDVSREMQKDLNDLFNVINQMNEVIAGIDAISMQTNLLALNASIEAARAGEAGRGFAIVADEIRGLAEQTQKLTGDMGNFVEGIKAASQTSTKSAMSTIEALDTMTERIEHVWEINNENQRHVSEVDESISSLAAVSEEISSSMNELDNQMQHVSGECQLLHSNTDSLQISNRSILELVEPAKMIEKHLEESTKIMGSMVQDAFYMLDNQVLLNCLNSAIDAHLSWLNTLQEMAQSGTLKVLQTDCTKCGLGHFYYAFKPVNPQIVDIWKGLEEKHKIFHSYGAEMINAIQSERSTDLLQIYEKAEICSKDLISDFQMMIQIIETLSKDNIRIFEEKPLHIEIS